MVNDSSIIGATTAVKTVRIPSRGKKVYYRGFLIHGEIPGLCYVIYGRNDFGQIAELGTAEGFTAAMRWIDRHILAISQPMPVIGLRAPNARHDERAAA